MNKKLYWGLGVLILLIIGATVFVVKDKAEMRELERQLAEFKKAEERVTVHQPPAREYYKMVRHGDHWHEVPIDAPDTGQGEPHEPVVANDAPSTAPQSKTEAQLSPTELNELYQQLAQDISLMDLDEELDFSEFLSKYSPKQRMHLLTVGINLSLLPSPVQDKIEGYQWRKQGLETPPEGYIYVKNNDGTYRLHKKGEPIIKVADVQTDEQGFFKSGAFTFMGGEDGQTFDEIMKAVEKEFNQATRER